jgi:hypothetical protein
MSSTIDEAADYTLSNPIVLIKPTARAFDVAPRTLSRKLNGGHPSQQILSPSEDKDACELERLGHAPKPEPPVTGHPSNALRERVN